MSKLSSSEIIAKGDYLKPDFDPSTLTVAQLLGVFTFHGVVYTTPYTKPKLVQLFNDQIRPNVDQFKKERLSRQNSQASDDGITDGLTGRPLNEGTRRTTRSVSRRASVAPPEPEEAPAPPRPDPVKRRRSSAEPSLGGGTTRRRAAKAPEPAAVAEDSEPEDEPPARKVIRKKTTGDAGAQSRRALAAVNEEIDSGWEDNNIFQSGAESASPSPVKPRTRKSSAIPTRSKKSMSVPPQFAPPPSSPTKQEPSRIPKRRGGSVKPPESDFDPALPEEVIRESKATTSRAREATPEVVITRQEVGTIILEDDNKFEIETDVAVSASESAFGRNDSLLVQPPSQVRYSPEADSTAAMSHRAESLTDMVIQSDRQSIASSSQDSVGRALVRPRKRKPSAAPIRNFFLAMLATAVLTTMHMYKTESSSIGFCETGKQTNSILEDLRVRRAAVEECNRLNRTYLFAPSHTDSTEDILPPRPAQTPVSSDESEVVLSEACPPPPLIPLPQPGACQPCPEHASCTPTTVTCDTGYLLRPHPLLAFLTPPGSTSSNSGNTYINPSLAIAPASASAKKSPLELAHTALSLVFDGVPSLGPVAFPPRCVEDPKRKRHIGALGKHIDNMLAKRRGDKLCAGVRPDAGPHSEAEEAAKWGFSMEELQQIVRKQTRESMLPTLENTFNEAIQQLVEWGGVFIGEDQGGNRYIAHRAAKLDSLCAVKVKALDAATWPNLGAIIAAFAIWSGIVASRASQRRQKAYQTQAKALLPSVFGMLQNKHVEHQADPTIEPYLSIVQLRDTLLQEEHSVSVRDAIWKYVEAAVSKNTNVRMNDAQFANGAQEYAWEWTGPTNGAIQYDVDSAPPTPA